MYHHLLALKVKKELSAMFIYYVYAYLREDATPYYIGMGQKRRAWAKDHNVNLPLDKKNIIILESNLSKVGALAIERRLIRWYGRKDLNTGILRNITDGGEGAEGVKGKVAWNKGKHQTVEHNLKISKSLSGLKKSAAHREKLKNSHTRPCKGKHWWNDGIIEVMSVDIPSIGYVKGRL